MSNDAEALAREAVKWAMLLGAQGFETTDPERARKEIAAVLLDQAAAIAALRRAEADMRERAARLTEAETADYNPAFGAEIAAAIRALPLAEAEPAQPGGNPEGNQSEAQQNKAETLGEAEMEISPDPARVGVREAAQVLLDHWSEIEDASANCDNEAIAIANRIAGPHGLPNQCPDGVQVLEDGETIMRAILRDLAGNGGVHHD